MNPRLTFVILSVLGACESSQRSSTATSAAPSTPAAPGVSAAPAAPAVTLAAGESLVSTPGDTVNQLAWKTPAGPVPVALVARDGQWRVKAYLPSGAADVTAPVKPGDFDHAWVSAFGDAVVYHFVPETTLLEHHHAERITWDAKAGKPVIAEVYDCTDEETDRPCEAPDWVWGKAPLPADPERPSAAEAVDTMQAWLGAVHANDAARAARLMTADVALELSYEPEGEMVDGCPAGRSSQTAAATAACAHGVLGEAKRMKSNVKPSSVSLDAPDGAQPAPHEIYVAVEGNGDEYDSLTAALVKHGDGVRIRAVWMSRSIADD
jgi:hypothetical protein